MDQKAYYTALGQLVYAIAMADGSIQTEERTQLINFVISEIVAIHKASGLEGSALDVFNIEEEFHRLRDENIPAQQAYDNFIEFIDSNKPNFNEKLKQTCLQIMDEIALAYNGIEDSEQEVIDEIKKKLATIQR